MELAEPAGPLVEILPVVVVVLVDIPDREVLGVVVEVLLLHLVQAEEVLAAGMGVVTMPQAPPLPVVV